MEVPFIFKAADTDTSAQTVLTAAYGAAVLYLETGYLTIGKDSPYGSLSS